MLHQFEIHASFGGDQPVNSAFGSLLHGALMERLPAAMQEAMHSSRIRPFSQYALPQPGQGILWRIGVWSDPLAEAYSGILKPGSSIVLSQKGAPLDIVRADHTCLSETAWIVPFMTAPSVNRLYEISFLTPCTHKSGGAYVMFPASGLIMGSLCRRFSEASMELRLDDEVALEALASHARIARYSLRSSSYCLEGIRLTGYTGWIRLFISGPEQLARLAGAVLSFASYAGVGIKTALGMGGCQVRPIPRTEKSVQTACPDQ